MSYPEGDPPNGQGNGDDRPEVPLPIPGLSGVDNYGVQRLPLPNFSLSSFMRLASYSATASTVASISPQESIYTEATRLRTENSQLRDKVAEQAWIAQRIAEKDAQIYELQQQKFALEQEIANFKQVVQQLNMENASLNKRFGEQTTQEDQKHQLPCSRGLVGQAQEKDKFMFSQKQAEEKEQCMLQFVDVLKTDSEEGAQGAEGIEKKSSQESSVPQMKHAREDEEEEDGERVKRPRKEALQVRAPFYDPEDAVDDIYDSPSGSPECDSTDDSDD